MTASVAAPGGAVPAAATVASRGKGSAAPSDGAFAHVLGEVHSAEVAAEGPAGWAESSVKLPAAWHAIDRGTSSDGVPPERAVLVDPSNPREAWNTLATAWASVTAVSHASVVDRQGAERCVEQGVVSSDEVLDVSRVPDACTVDSVDVASRAVPAVGLESAGHTPVAPRTEAAPLVESDVARPVAQAPEQQGVRPLPTIDPGARVPVPVVEVTSRDAEGMPPEAEPSSGQPSFPQHAAPVSGYRHEARESTIEAAVLARSDAATPEAASLVPPVVDRAAPTGGREAELGPSLPDAPALVVAPAPTRPTPDVGLDVSMDASAPVATGAATVVDQIVKSMRVQWTNNIGEARIQLRPEHLGPVDVSIKVDGGSVTAVVRAESSRVQEWILSHQQSLRQQLEAAGLRLDALVVSPDAERRGDREAAEARQHPAPRRRRVAGETRIFEVTV